MKKILAFTIVLSLIASVFIACGAGASGSRQILGRDFKATAPAAPAPAASAPSTAIAGGFAMDMGESVAYESEARDMPTIPPETGGGIAGPSVNQVVDSRKIIKNINLQLQTLTFDKSVDSVARIAESFEGFVQNSYVEGRDMYGERGARTANFTIRIPSERLDSFVNSFGGDEFNVISKSQNSDDITESYYDSKARLDALKIQEERLLSMLESAAELEYLLQVEKELMNVRYEIESLTSALNRMDSYVSLSTVNIALFEVVKYEQVEDLPVSFAERISRAFSSSWVTFSDFSQDFAVTLVSVLPFLLLLLVIVLVVVAVVRKSVKRASRRKNHVNQAASSLATAKFDVATPVNSEEIPERDESQK